MMNPEEKYGIEYLDSVDSTNAYLKRRIASGCTESIPFAAAAKEQTSGRGRNGRVWLNTDGALMMSVAVRVGKLEHAPLYSLAAACAARDTIASVCPGVMIKWPNDIIAADESGYRKLCGILSELVQSPQGDWFAVLGTGINVNAGRIPPGLLQPASSLFIETGREHDIRSLSTALFEETCKKTALLECSTEKLLCEYISRCMTIGKRVRAIGADGLTVIGIAEAVDGSGRLIINNERGQRITVSAADVSIRNAK